MYNTLLSRILRRRQKENKREAIAEEINEKTRLELTPFRSRGCYYSDQIFFERETSGSRASRVHQQQIEPKLNAKMEGRNKMTVTVKNLGPEAAIALIKAAEEKIKGAIQQEPPHKRKG